MNIINKYTKYISPIDEIIDNAKNGRMFILVDEDDRENEGDNILKRKESDYVHNHQK